MPGSQYTSFRLAEHLQEVGIAASIGSVGDAYDNSLTESTIGLYRTELLKPRRPWRTLSYVEIATTEYIDWYNHRRLHGEIGHIPPVEQEVNHYLTTAKPQVTTNNGDLYGTRSGSVVHRMVTSAPQRQFHAQRADRSAHRVSFTATLPMYAPPSRSTRACGAAGSPPSTTVCGTVNRPSAIHWAKCLSHASI